MSNPTTWEECETMSDESRPDPLSLVSHVNRSKTGISKLQLTIPIELRARLARASSDHSIPQLALIRTAISAYLTSLEKRSPTPAPTSGGPARPGELGSVPDHQEPPPEASVGHRPAPPGTLWVGSPSGNVLVPVTPGPQGSEDNQGIEPGPIPEPALTRPMVPIKRRGGRSRTSAPPK